MSGTVRSIRGGVWLGASYVLGRDVPVNKPYPHICGNTVQGAITGESVQLWRKECAACAEETFERKRADAEARARRGAA